MFLLHRPILLLQFYYSVHQGSAKVTNKDHSQSKATTEVESLPDIDVDSPANEEPPIELEDKTDGETSNSIADNDTKSSNTTSKETESNKEIASKDSTEKTAQESSTNKSVTASKPKPSRDKNGGSVTGGRVTSKSHISGSDSGGNASGTSRKPTPSSQAGWAGNYILEPDPKVR